MAVAICALSGSLAVPYVSAGDLAIESVVIGFDGHHKISKWTPVRVRVETERPMVVRLVLEAPDPHGNLAIYPSEEIHLTTAGKHVLQSIFQSGRPERGVQIRIMENSTTLSARTIEPTGEGDSTYLPALKHSAVLVATIGEPKGFVELQEIPDGGPSESDASRSIVVVALDGLSHLPEQLAGFDGLDALVVSGDYEISKAHSDVVREWVRMGGHLVVAVGSEADAYRQSPLSAWIPVSIDEGASRLRKLKAIESFVGKNRQIHVPHRGIVVPRLKSDQGVTLVRGIDGPLLIRIPYGFGRITFLGLDLDRAPLAEWDLIADFAGKLLGSERKRPRLEQRSKRGRLSHSGITDLASQIHAAQDDFPEIRRLSNWMVMGLITLYLILIGPLDYLLVHRVLKRPQWTWVTFPTMVVGALIFAAWGAQASNGDRLELNQLDVVDIDVASGLVRSQSWTTIYSNENRRYAVSIRPLTSSWAAAGDSEPPRNPAEGGILVGWSGIPEDCFGGLYRRGELEPVRWLSEDDH